MRPRDDAFPFICIRCKVYKPSNIAIKYSDYVSSFWRNDCQFDGEERRINLRIIGREHRRSEADLTTIMVMVIVTRCPDGWHIEWLLMVVGYMLKSIFVLDTKK